MKHDIYTLSDKAITLLNRRAIKRFKEEQNRLGLLKFDELTIVRGIEKLYQTLDADNREVFLDLAQLVYEKSDPHGAKKPNKTWLDSFLDAYDPVTLYIYTNEADRKRDYATESIVAAKEKSEAFQRALKYWSKFTATYADLVTDASTVKAFKDAGVKQVIWHTERDDRVCSDCEPRDEKVYPIDKIPPKPHIGCRCWLEAVKRKNNENH